MIDPANAIAYCPAGAAQNCAHLRALRLVTTAPKHRGDR